MADTLSQLPSEVNLSFISRDTFRIRVRVMDPESMTPEDLSGYKFCAEIAQDVVPRSIVAEFTITPDPDAPNEAVILTLTPQESAPLPGMGDGRRFQGVWDLEVTFPSGDVRTVAAGTVVVGIDVSDCQITP